MYSINNLTLEFPGRTLFDNIGFVINSRDRIGLVGRNGAGKSTLLKIFAGLEGGYTGQIAFPKDKTVGYLVQERSFVSNKTVMEEAETSFAGVQQRMSELDRIAKEIANSTDYESKHFIDLSEKWHNINEHLQIISGTNYQEQIEKVLKGLGFLREDMYRPMSELSGGWQMRVELAKLLLQHPDLLLLDEPTNHLDIDSIRWLEGFLKNYQGAIVLVSHDRVLLDNVTTRTIEVQQGNAYDYNSSYSDYVLQRQERIEQQSAEIKNQQREIAQIESFVERFRYKATKAKQVQSRLKQLDKFEEINIDDIDNSKISFKFAPAKESGKIVVEAKQVAKNYDTKTIIKPTDFIIARNECIAFVGQNGQGKSTLIKMITNKIDFEGKINLGYNVQIGYFAQNQTEMLDKSKTLFETLEDVADNETRPKIRNILGNFMFSGDDVNKKVLVLSGGEKTRLALAKLLLQPVNFLVLDEPTNHLDMAAKDVLKNALLHFNGTLIIVSHDRDFLSGLSTKIFEFRDGNIKQLDYSINDLMELRDLELEKIQKSSLQNSDKEISASKQTYLNNKEKDKQKRKIEKQIATIEEEINTIENDIVEIEELLNNPEKVENKHDFSVFAAKHAELKSKLKDREVEWGNMVEKLENL